MMSILFLLMIVIGVGRAINSPNIILFLADDMGWNDISFHGSNQFQTANIDALAYSGVILQDYYTQPICTPARSALLTARHPIHNGMEHNVIYAPEPWGLPLTDTLLPEYLKSAGYVTHAIGKWHLGFFRKEYTPTFRGFDSHYGVWLGHQDYYTHQGYEPQPGYDFHRGLNVSWEAEGGYSTDLFTQKAEEVIADHNTDQPLFLYLAHTAPHAPLQAPQSLVDKFNYIPEVKRQKFAAMVSKVDESVGRVVQALAHRHMLNNSIILFLSDNGGASNGFNGNVASNWPLKGCKDTLWEGGVRSVGLVWSPLLKATPRLHRGLVNVQDWLPTLLSAINKSELIKDESKLDGVSQWEALNKEVDPPYHIMLHNIDPVRNISALRYGQWKIIRGRTYSGKYDGYSPKLNGEIEYDLDVIRSSETGQALEDTSCPLPTAADMLSLRLQATITCKPPCPDLPACKPHIAPCLFNIKYDPCERHNLANRRRSLVSQLVALLESYELQPPNNQRPDPRSYPVHWNNTWTHWVDFLP